MRLQVACAVALLAGCGESVESRLLPEAAVSVDAGAAQDRPAVDLGATEDVTVELDAPDVIDAGEDGTVEPDALVEEDAPDIDDVGVAKDASPEVDAGPREDLGARGPFTVATWTGSVTGVSGTTRIHYPSSGAGRHPLVVFAHGFQLGTNNYDGLLTHVASWGFVVASVDYPGSLLGVDHRGVPTAIAAARAVLEAGRVDFPGRDRVMAGRSVAMGHSLGGKGAVMAVLTDRAFVAGVALDPVDDNPAPLGSVSESAPSIAPERMGGLARPLALFGATQSRCGLLGAACAPEASNWQRFAESAPAGVTVGRFPLNNFGHNDFVDTACGVQCAVCARGAAPIDTRARALRLLTTAFLFRYALDDARYQGWVNGAERAALVRAGLLWNEDPATLPACR